MADNLGWTEGSGKTLATNDVSGIHYPKTKLIDGTAGSTDPIKGDSTYGLDVDVTRIADAKSLTKASSNGTPITTATDTILVSAPSAGNHIRVHRIHASNQSSTPVVVSWRDGAAGTKRYETYLPLGGLFSIPLKGSWRLTTATALYLNTSAAGSILWHVDYEVVPD